MKKFMLWMIAFLITVFVIFYQRLTGPTYPIKGKVTLENEKISFRLPRAHVTSSDCPVKMKIQDNEIKGSIFYKRFKTNDPVLEIAMQREGQELVGYLPTQPTAGKLEYRVVVTKGETSVSLSEEKPVVIRFRGDVPAYIFIPHVIIIFLALLFSTRAGFEAMRPDSNPRKLAIWTTVFLALGGMIMGPIMQKFAFGAFWTGFPFGADLTDNKTVVALIGWIIALIAGRKGRPARGWVLGAAILLLIVFLIPHSLLGSELDYSEMDAQNQQMVAETANSYLSFYLLN